MPNPPLPTPEQLEAWGALCEQATPGPWEHVEWTNHGKEDHAGSIRSAGKPVDRGDFAPPTETWSWHIAKMEPDSPAPEANAAFIATARTALPSLLAAYREKEADAKRFQALAELLFIRSSLTLRRQMWEEGVSVEVDEYTTEPVATTDEAIRAAVDAFLATDPRRHTPTPSDRL